MIAILALWGRALRDRHPLALPVDRRDRRQRRRRRRAGAAGGRHRLVGLDPTSLYHLAQIPGMVLLYHAIAVAPQRQEQPARPEPGGAAR